MCQSRCRIPPAISRLSEIRVPTLIIVGDQDVRTILQIADILENGIVGAKKVVIPGTAHHLNMEKPEEFNRAVLDFLGALG
jgi:3-oxoadipate enol-lactonase